MTLPSNGTLKRIVAGVALSVFMFLSGMVIANKNAISELGIKVANNTETALALRDQAEKTRTELLNTIERNRTEARNDFDKLRAGQEDLRKELSGKLDAIVREVKK